MCILVMICALSELQTRSRSKNDPSFFSTSPYPRYVYLTANGLGLLGPLPPLPLPPLRTAWNRFPLWREKPSRCCGGTPPSPGAMLIHPETREGFPTALPEAFLPGAPTSCRAAEVVKQRGPQEDRAAASAEMAGEAGRELPVALPRWFRHYHRDRVRVRHGTNEELRDEVRKPWL